MKTNIIYNEECAKGMEKLPDDSIDLVVTSPPYDNLRDYNGYSFNFEDVAKQLERVLKIGGVIVWVVGDATINGSETGTSFKQALYFMSLGLNLHDTMIYIKKGGLPINSNRYEPKFEYMFILSKGKPKTFNPIKEISKYAGSKICSTYRSKEGELLDSTKKGKKIKDKKVIGNVWKFNVGYQKTTRDEFAFEHPAMFPEQLAKDHIISWSNEGDIILDPFMGSGTTAKIAELTNRKWIGYELSEEYIQIAYKRVANYNKKYLDKLDDENKPEQLQMF